MGEESTEREKILKQALDTLGEHFDTVQIFVTSHESDDDGTYNGVVGHGNYFARYGLVHEWMTRKDEEIRSQRRESE